MLAVMVRAALALFCFAVTVGAQTVSLTASRTSGVAPLAVHFHAIGTTADGVQRPFHDLHYAWQWGDGGDSSGPVAAHVFDLPGRYTVSLTVTRPGGGSSSATTRITVADPNEVFAGKDTVVCSNDKDFQGAPARAKRVTTSSFDTVIAHLEAGKRVLLARGDTFTATSRASVSGGSGPWILGAFGVGTRADGRGLCDNNPVVVANHGGALLVFGSGRRVECRDLRVTDITFRSSAETPGDLFGVGYRIEDVLLYRCRGTGFETAVSWGDSVPDYFDVDTHSNATVANCEFVDSWEYGCYFSARGGAWLDCRIVSREPMKQHVLRFPYSERLVVSGCELAGSGAKKHVIKAHSRPFGGDPDDVSREIVVRDCRIEVTSDWGCGFGTASPSRDERVRDVIVERCRFTLRDRTATAIMLWGRQMTVRNCTFGVDATDRRSRYGVQIQKRGEGQVPAGCAIYHCTAHTMNESVGNFRLGSVAAHEGDPVPIRNCLMWAPNVDNAVIAHGNAALYDESGNLVGVDPRFTSPTDWRPRPGSPAIDHGKPAPVADDMDGERRGARPDAGAFESRRGRRQR